jgi:hypothetical protein
VYRSPERGTRSIIKKYQKSPKKKSNEKLGENSKFIYSIFVAKKILKVQKEVFNMFLSFLDPVFSSRDIFPLTIKNHKSLSINCQTSQLRLPY